MEVKYVKLYDAKNALKDFQALILVMKGKYTEAKVLIEEHIKEIHKFEKEKGEYIGHPFPYTILAHCQAGEGDYRKALKTYLEVKDMFQLPFEQI